MAPNVTKRMTGILAVILCAVVAGYFLIRTGSDSHAGTPSSATNPSEKASVSIRNVLKGQSRESSSGFWIAYDGSHGETLSPSNLAVYVRVANNTVDPLKVVTYSAQMQVDGAWLDLPRIPFGNSHTPYFGFSPEALQPLVSADSRTGSVSLEAHLGTAIRPKAEVEGWALFEYPDAVKNTDDATVRVTLSTNSGDAFTAEANKNDIAAMGGVPVDIGGRIDLSRLRVGWYSKLYGQPK